MSLWYDGSGVPVILLGAVIALLALGWLNAELRAQRYAMALHRSRLAQEEYARWASGIQAPRHTGWESAARAMTGWERETSIIKRGYYDG